MPILSVAENLNRLLDSLPAGVELVAVSKTHPAALVRQAYDAGQRIFGENRPQEMASKRLELPDDIRWHQIGHLQTNKVKLIAPFVSMVHSGDSARLLREISARAVALGRVIDVLVEIRIGREQPKEGWDFAELRHWLSTGEWRSLAGIRIRGVMGVATFTDDLAIVRAEFSLLADHFRELRTAFFSDAAGFSAAGSAAGFDIISAGMSGDYRVAIECGSNLIRVGSSIFGNRN
jgi:pyridoxal phosphate enzyme (YggS family)